MIQPQIGQRWTRPNGREPVGIWEVTKVVANGMVILGSYMPIRLTITELLSNWLLVQDDGVQVVPPQHEETIAEAFLAPALPEPVDHTATHTFNPYFFPDLTGRPRYQVCQDCGASGIEARGEPCSSPGSRWAICAWEAEILARQSNLNYPRSHYTPPKPPRLPVYGGLRTGVGSLVCAFGWGRK